MRRSPHARKVRRILLIIYTVSSIIAALGFSASALALGNDSFGHEDAMCSAIFVSAIIYHKEKVKNGIDTQINLRQIDFYTILSQVFMWKQKQNHINDQAYDTQVGFYFELLDRELAMLHFDRCYHLGFQYYAERAGQ